jgi:hypothetical protein
MIPSLKGAALKGAAPIALLLLSGCSQPQPFQRGQQIPLGPYSVSFNYAEIRDASSRRALVVHFHCEQVASLNGRDRFQQRFFTAFKVKDSSGKSYRGVPFLEQEFRHLQGNTLFSMEPRDERMSARDWAFEDESLRGGPNVREWVAVFAVPVDAQGFQLYVRNPDRREGQPGEAVIDLGR